MLGDGKYVGLRARVATAVVCVSILAVLYALYEFTSIGHAGFYLLAFLAATFAAYEYGAVLYGAPYLLGSLEGDALGVRESSLTLAVGASLIAVLPVLGQFILGDLAWGGFGGMPLTDRMALFLSLVVLALSSGLLFSVMRGGSDLADATSSMLEVYVGIALIGVGGGSLLFVLSAAQGVECVLWLMLVVFTNDIAAYFVGKQLKGPKLSPYISPNKTVSGAIGGVLFGVVVGFLTLRGESSVFRIGLPLVVVVMAQSGDLAKSLIKRRAGVKDSGTILPGHGGVLDRIDGVLGAAPIVTLWILGTQ